MFTIILDHLFYSIETLGIFSFALSGVILAKKKDYDIVGVYVVAWVTAFGGGILRDLMLDNHPLYWISHSEYPLILLLLVLFLSIFKRFNVHEKWLHIPDALGLATFAVTTAQTAYLAGYPFIIVGILATVVGTFGGLLRDVLCQEVPYIFKKNTTMYASIAFLGACFFVALSKFTEFDQFLTMSISIVFIFIFRILAKKLNLVLRL